MKSKTSIVRNLRKHSNCFYFYSFKLSLKLHPLLVTLYINNMFEYKYISK